MYGFNYTDIKNARTEICVFAKAFDEIYSNTVMARTSYIASEIEWGAKFKIMYHPSADKMKTVLDISQLNSLEKADIPESKGLA